jgi:tRNA (cmo5U34)-methyltransferase
MNDFNQTRWADSTFSQEYLASADHYIPDRFHLFHVLRSFYRAFVAHPKGVRVCDLGSGDGVLTDHLLREGTPIEATLVDGSAEMLTAARRRFVERPGVQFIQKSFAELVEDSSALGQFHFIISSFAIHHLGRAERQRLLATAFRHLEPGGCFMNIEATLPNHAGFTEWYYQLWQEWIVRRGQLLGLGDRFQEVPAKARSNPDNQYSRLAEQLEDLAAAGFREVECHYKNGMFAIYTGRRDPPAMAAGGNDQS